MRNTIKILLTAAGFVLSGAVAAAEPEELSCGSKFDTASAVNQCLAEAVVLVERDMETMRQALLKALETAQAKLQNAPGASTRPPHDAVEKAQKTWREYRDANCQYYEQVYTAVSPPGAERVVCQLRMTRQRMFELNSERQFWVYKFREADMPAQGDAK